MRTQSMNDARSLALHRLVVEKIQSDPLLFGQVKATLSKWRDIVDQRSQPYLIEWQTLIAWGMDECLKLAVEETEHADALRKSSPFAGVLTNDERLTVLRRRGKQSSKL